VEAAVRLSLSNDAQLWCAVEGQYPNLVEDRDDDNDLQKQRKRNMRELESFYDDLGQKMRSGKMKSLTREFLTNIVNWKFSVGKKRPYNVLGNSEEAIKTCSKKAITLAEKIGMGEDLENLNKRIEGALKDMMELKGVGPATASAVLSMVSPHVFCYMYDETIDCFESQRKYDIKCYLRINRECMTLASALGPGWTTKRVARTLWIAARVCADPSCKDLTLVAKGKKKMLEQPGEAKAAPAKRRKR
jgi:hypothetical protein